MTTTRRNVLRLSLLPFTSACSRRGPPSASNTSVDVGAALDPPTGTRAKQATVSDLIEHVVIIVKENRTYDVMFGEFPEGEPDERDAPECAALISGDGLEHGRETALNPERHLHCHDESSEAETYHALARTFTLCARFFSEVRGPSFPNHLMLLAAQAPFDDDPRVAPRLWKCPRYCYDYRTLVDQLAAAGRSWRAYDATNFVSSFSMIRHLAHSPNVVPWQRFEADARAGRLPHLSYVFSDEQDSEHPPADVCAGEAWTLRQVRAVAEGPLWQKTAMFIVWDDWGGFRDHVKPPVVERDAHGRPLRYGARVPCLVVSPYSRRSYISVAAHSHLSILRFVEDVFGLPPLNQRVAEASAMADCFDFSQAAGLAVLPNAPICRHRL